MVTILFAVLAIVAILWVVMPVMAETETSSQDAPPEPRHDPARPVLEQITDLDLEYAAGKIPESAYKHVRADLAVQAAAALAARDEASAARDEASAAREESSMRPPETRPQAAGKAAVSAAAGSGSSAGKKGKASAFCPGCGRPTRPQDKFCAGCGRNLKS